MADGEKRPKGILAILTGKGKPEDGDGDDEDGGSKEPKSAEARALKEMHEALESGDWDGAASAFRDAYDACSSGGGYEDGEEEDGEDEEA